MSRPGADARLRRILSVVPWVAAADGPAIAEVCQRFGYDSEDELRADFDLLFVCGIHPYTPDTLIDVDMADGRVWVRYADYFARPLRLTAAEALSLVASSAALLGVEGHDVNGPLARGLAKLAVALGVDPDEVVDVELGPAPRETLALLREAIADRHQVEIDYYGFGRDERTTRVVDPVLVYGAGGQWYVAAFCHRADDRRLFRLDRIERVRRLESTFSPPERSEELAAQVPAIYEPSPTDPRIVLDLEVDAGWVADYYPVESVVELDKGRRRVSLPVSGTAWLERLLLRLGPTARLVAGDASAGRAAGERVLARYLADG